MGNAILHFLRSFIADYGYWAVAISLLFENAGVPVPGETTLLLAAFLASSEQKLHLEWIIVVATSAATLGDNLGYLIGFRGGRPLLERYQNAVRIRRDSLERGEKLMARYGPLTIFFARFVFGMRIFAGPLAGVLRMPWKSFALFNFLGALAWVSVIALTGYLFGKHWEALAHGLRLIDLAIMIALAFVLTIWWRRHRRGR
jgi:membrane protein DedA with SNARE-associated domain